MSEYEYSVIEIYDTSQDEFNYPAILLFVKGNIEKEEADEIKAFVRQKANELDDWQYDDLESEAIDELLRRGYESAGNAVRLYSYDL